MSWPPTARSSKQGKTPAEADEYLHKLFENVPVQDDSARKSLQTFTGGKGDVMLAYENEAIFAQQNGQPIDYVVPDQTILIENPVAVTTDDARTRRRRRRSRLPVHARRAARSSPTTATGPVVNGVAKPDEFPTPTALFTIDDLGGWTEVTDEVLRSRERASWPRSSSGIGVSTSK